MATAANKTKLIVDIDTDLKKEFKVLCTKNDTSMTVIVEGLIQKYMEQMEPKN